MASRPRTKWGSEKKMRCTDRENRKSPTRKPFLKLTTPLTSSSFHPSPSFFPLYPSITFNMSDEVYDGAIGIDLGKFLHPNPLPKRKRTRSKLLTDLKVPPTLALPTTTVTMSRSVCFHSGAVSAAFARIERPILTRMSYSRQRAGFFHHPFFRLLHR